MLYRIKLEEHTLENGREFHVASHPELPGCHGFGATLDEALHRLSLAREGYLHVLKDMGTPIPESEISKISCQDPATAGAQGKPKATWAYI